MERRQTDRTDGASPVLEILARKAKLLDSLPECAFLIDADHEVLTANAAAALTFGMPPEEMVGRPLRDVLAVLTNGDGSKLNIDAPIARSLSTDEAELLDGWLSGDAPDAGNGGGNLRKVAITVLPQHAGGDEEMVTVIVGGEAVRQPYGLRDAVLSMVSHELRTPLLHIKGFVSSLLESDIEWDEDTRLDFLHTIDREADRLTSMVSDLLEITRMGSGDLPLHMENADPYLLAYAAIDSASPFVRRHRVLVEVPEDLPKVYIDVLRLTGVLVNLLENAAKYSEEGSRITIGAETGQDAVTFSVSDHGVGIPEEAHDRIFSMFYRGEFGGKKSSGTGLGLAVCKAVVEAHGGDIRVESQVGKGSTFRFTVPRRPAATAGNTVGKTAAGPGKTRRSRKAGGPGNSTKTVRSKNVAVVVARDRV